MASVLWKLQKWVTIGSQKESNHLRPCLSHHHLPDIDNDDDDNDDDEDEDAYDNDNDSNVIIGFILSPVIWQVLPMKKSNRCFFWHI